MAKRVVHEHNKPQNVIPGAKFKLYLNAQDAKAEANAIKIDGIDEWTTDANGRLVIPGLRFTDFAKGLDLADGGVSCYQLYWAMPTHIPPEYEWVTDDPIPGTVESENEYDTIIFEVETEKPVKPTPEDPEKPEDPAKPGDPATPKDPAKPTPQIPVTGGQITGALILAGVLLAGGIVMFVRRKQKQE